MRINPFSFQDSYVQYQRVLISDTESHFMSSYIFEPHKNPVMNGADIIYILKQSKVSPPHHCCLFRLDNSLLWRLSCAPQDF